MTYPPEFEAIFRLPVAQRLELLDDLWASIAAEQNDEPVPEEVLNIVRERDARYAADPSSAITWEEAKRRLREG